MMVGLAAVGQNGSESGGVSGPVVAVSDHASGAQVIEGLAASLIVWIRDHQDDINAVPMGGLEITWGDDGASAKKLTRHYPRAGGTRGHYRTR